MTSNLIITHAPALLIAIPLFSAFITPLLSRIHHRIRDGFVVIVLAATDFLALLLAQDIYTHGIRRYVFGATLPSLTHPTTVTIPVRIIFEVDGLSIFMVLISLTIAFVAAIYSTSFFKKEDGLDRYYTLLFLLTVGMIGMELTGDMFNFFVFLEITSIASCALIAFWIDRGESLEAAFKYIVISSIGALFVLMAIGFLYGQYDALNIAMLAKNLQFTFIDKIALVLLLAALAMKAGIAPMHMWLPDAYGEAPPSVTIAVVAATQASLYGVLRVCFTLYGKGVELDMTTIGWLLVGLGLLTVFIGVTMALVQKSLTRTIAFAAVGEIGYMVIGAGTALAANLHGFANVALKGGVFHIFNDVLDIGLLFLVAGAVIYATKERDLNNLGGLAKKMKYTTIFFLIGLLAVAGMPPMNGFASKILIYESTYQLNPIISIIAILSSILLLAIFVKIFYSLFLGPELPHLKDVKEVPRGMLIAMAILTVLIIFFGLFPGYVLQTIVDPAVAALSNPTNYINAILGGA
ncbi:MAG TPA: NADH:ubiquinone oxidoreductase [Thermoplasmatales archaeon]|nr:NADH:ubiquinone oxidoreductase [Thermoplasmatales archaeon]